MALCPKCGHPNDAPARFCTQCGASLSAAPPASPASPPGTPTSPRAASRKINPRLLLGALVLVLIAAYLHHRWKPTSPDGQAPQAPTAPSALARRQHLDVQWQNEGGTVMLTGQWTNNSGTTIGSALVECDQLDVNNALVVKNDVTLDGPLAPGATKNFMRVRLGQIYSATGEIDCKIVSVKTGS
jgi:hypothetical protein